MIEIGKLKEPPGMTVLCGSKYPKINTPIYLMDKNGKQTVAPIGTLELRSGNPINIGDCGKFMGYGTLISASAEKKLRLSLSKMTERDKSAVRALTKALKNVNNEPKPTVKTGIELILAESKVKMRESMISKLGPKARIMEAINESGILKRK